MSESIRFPKRFLWGASSSAHQVEGGTHNQWSEWEDEHAQTLAAQAPYQYSELDSWKMVASSAKRPGNYISGRAVNHWEKWREDFDLLEKLELNTYRFSIEWSRVEPNEGAWDSAALQHYKQYLAELRKRNITPVVTLFHFTEPLWFSQKGGFSKRKNIRHYTQFVEKIAEELGSDLSYVITINEPTVYASQSYYEGNWPPNVRSKWQTLRVVRNLLRAHKEAARVLHERSRRIRVSMAHNVSYVYAGDDAWLSQTSARLMDWVHNHYTLKRAVKSSDFIGLNYYFSNRVYGYRVHNPDDRVSDLGWDMQPSHLRYVLEDLDDRYHMPIVVTENGLADAKDEHRSWWLQETVQALWQARNNGVDVEGYIHWSLTDTVEWDKGKWPRFGLVAVNYQTMQRQIRPSAQAFARVIKQVRSKV